MQTDRELIDRTENVPYLVADIEKVPGASNAFHYINNSGVVSAPIVIGGGEDAPIPVNAASTVKIPKEAWQAQTDGYSYTLTAAMHGQMRDGATANDLWVSFDETENSKLQGVYADYSVAENGDITIVVNSPIDMTVRVWNGKGLVDEVARENVVKEEERATAAEAQLQQNIDAETQRAESAEKAIRSDLVGMINAETQRAKTEENNLQAQIDHIEQSGVDLTARAEIAQEVERATAAETAIRSDLQSEIKQEQQRAIQAEQDLQTQITTNVSDIQGLREDITNESHFRGMFNSVEELRAAYPTATPNDYAWIAGGNIWIWKDNAWTDSREPVPSTAVPASNATPLMDGTASAGTANSYARGDHRHPSDSNKVSKSGDTMTGSYRLIGKLTVGETIDAGHVWTNKLSLKNNNNPNDVAQLSFDGTRVSMEKQFGANGVYDNDRRVYSPNNPQVPYFSNTDIPSGSNLNNYINPGIYTSQSNDSTLSNLPSGSSSAGKLIVYTTTSSSSYVNQEWQEVATDNRWVRSSNADGGTRVWQAWKYIGGNVYSPNNPPPTDKLAAYPVGAIYIADKTTSPASLFGGSWERLSGEYYLRTTTDASLLGRYYGAALPNITGDFGDSQLFISGGSTSGTIGNGALRAEASQAGLGVGKYFVNNKITFDASRSNPIYGKSDTVSPKSYCVYMWRRTA